MPSMPRRRLPKRGFKNAGIRLWKIASIWPLTRYYRFEPREGMYTTLMMSTGLTFGTISALFGLTNGVIDQEQYTVLVSAVVPTLIAEKWFHPAFREVSEETGPAGKRRE